MTLTKQFCIVAGKTLELRAAGYNVFNQVRRTTVNSGVQFKANGASYSHGLRFTTRPINWRSGPSRAASPTR